MFVFTSQFVALESIWIPAFKFVRFQQLKQIPVCRNLLFTERVLVIKLHLRTVKWKRKWRVFRNCKDLREDRCFDLVLKSEGCLVRVKMIFCTLLIESESFRAKNNQTLLLICTLQWWESFFCHWHVLDWIDLKQQKCACSFLKP